MGTLLVKLTCTAGFVPPEITNELLMANGVPAVNCAKVPEVNVTGP